jgi:hypothetical protein
VRRGKGNVREVVLMRGVKGRKDGKRTWQRSSTRIGRESRLGGKGGGGVAEGKDRVERRSSTKGRPAHLTSLHASSYKAGKRIVRSAHCQKKEVRLKRGRTDRS